MPAWQGAFAFDAPRLIVSSRGDDGAKQELRAAINSLEREKGGGDQPCYTSRFQS